MDMLDYLIIWLLCGLANHLFWSILRHTQRTFYIVIQNFTWSSRGPEVEFLMLAINIVLGPIAIIKSVYTSFKQKSIFLRPENVPEDLKHNIVWEKESD